MDFLECDKINKFMNKNKCYNLGEYLIYFLYINLWHKFPKIMGAKIYLTDLDTINLFNRFSKKCMNDKNKKEIILKSYKNNKLDFKFCELKFCNDFVEKQSEKVK